MNQFKEIPGWERYGVSKDGQVMNLETGKIRKSTLSTAGYLRVCLHNNSYRKQFSIHQLVVMTYLDHTIDGLKIVVDHINEIKTDNRLENLQLITNRENTSKSKRRDLPTGVTMSRHRKYVSRIRINGRIIHIGTFDTPEEAHQAYLETLSHSTI